MNTKVLTSKAYVILAIRIKFLTFCATIPMYKKLLSASWKYQISSRLVVPPPVAVVPTSVTEVKVTGTTVLSSNTAASVPIPPRLMSLVDVTLVVDLTSE